MGKEEWQFVNSFAPWLSAAGTIFAASIALYVALRKPATKLKPEVLFRGDVIEFRVTNVGAQPAMLAQLFVPLGGKRLYVSDFGNLNGVGSRVLPEQVVRGDVFNTYLSFTQFLPQLDGAIPAQVAEKEIRQLLTDATFVCRTTIGESFTAGLSVEQVNELVRRLVLRREPAPA
jgi:hypothetical protein